MPFIDVIIPLPINQRFTYRVREAEANFLNPGMRVVVPFGRNKLVTALVYGVLLDERPKYQTKEIDQILDHEPIVTTDQLKFWQWMSEYYLCSMGEVMRAALPGSLLLESETYIVALQTDSEQWSELSDQEFLLMEALSAQPHLSIQDIRDILSKNAVMRVVQALMEKGFVSIQEHLKDKYKPLKRKFVKLHPDALELALNNGLFNELNRAPKQRELMTFMLSRPHDEFILQSELIQATKTNAAVISALIKKSRLIVEEQILDRIPKFKGAVESLSVLSEDQQKALQAVNNVFDSGRPCLLHGVTSSGKTRLYIHLMKDYLDQGKHVLLIVPEIALTTQLIGRLQKFFGSEVGVYHSRQSPAERVELYRRVKDGSAEGRIIVGARSSLFLPFNNLGLIVLDESHEPSLKQHSPSPRYHGRDAAIMLAHQYGAQVLMGSATPSLESYFNAKKNKFGLVELTQRFGGIELPDIQVIDLGEQYKKKLIKHHFSSPLIEAIEQALNKNEQVLLFQNRRGFSALIECLRCGHVPGCPDCDVSLTYHSHQQVLRCHYCGHQSGVPALCSACGGNELDRVGLGTQQIEEALVELFPQASVARMDQDTTKGKYAFASLIDQMNQGTIDILVGTQMLAKGLDFERVTLVGILSADQLMNFPDFRAHERAYQLMSQVSGRAGRRQARGKVIIQTYQPDHPLLKQVVTGDYQNMFEQQNKQRSQFLYPPYSRLIRITVKHRALPVSQNAARWLAQVLSQQMAPNVLGPVAPLVGRVRNQYLQQLMIKVPVHQSLSNSKLFIEKVRQKFLSQKAFSQVSLTIDVDPI